MGISFLWGGTGQELHVVLEGRSRMLLRTSGPRPLEQEDLGAEVGIQASDLQGGGPSGHGTEDGQPERAEHDGREFKNGEGESASRRGGSDI